MTYSEYYAQIREDFAIKSDAFVRAEKKLTESRGFIDSKIHTDYHKARVEWQNSANTYVTFQDFWKEHSDSLNPDDEM